MHSVEAIADASWGCVKRRTREIWASRNLECTQGLKRTFVGGFRSGDGDGGDEEPETSAPMSLPLGLDAAPFPGEPDARANPAIVVG